MALYRKYRPNVFADVVGQKNVLQILKNAIESNKVSHAYLFCGPRGTGKTTMARLVAKACLCSSAESLPTFSPCGKCQECIDIAKSEHPDVYELDAASRTGVDNVREEIIGRVSFASTRGKKKIYIIDEVHMLSTAAFNALLKTLEEPPEHVIFVLCTTDPQKVPDTILSRCQRFDFHAISVEDIVSRLKYVCQAEGIEADDDTLHKIAVSADGAMRNALSKLEQLISYSEGKVITISEDNVDLTNLLEAISIRNLKDIFKWIDDYCNKGADFENLTYLLTKHIRDIYIEGNSELFSNERLHRMMINLGDLNSDLKSSSNARLTFEIAMAKIASPKHDLTLESLAERISDLEKTGVTEPVVKKEVKTEVVSIPEPEPDPVVEDISVEEIWDKAYMNIKKKYPAYGAILLTAKADFDESTNQFVLQFPKSSEFAMATINKPETMEKLKEEICNVYNKEVGLDLRMTNEVKEEKETINPVVTQEDTKDIKEILSNFGATNITEK